VKGWAGLGYQRTHRSLVGCHVCADHPVSDHVDSPPHVFKSFKGCISAVDSLRSLALVVLVHLVGGCLLDLGKQLSGFHRGFDVSHVDSHFSLVSALRLWCFDMTLLQVFSL